MSSSLYDTKNPVPKRVWPMVRDMEGDTAVQNELGLDFFGDFLWRGYDILPSQIILIFFYCTISNYCEEN